MSEPPPLRIGTRGSALARWQADWVAAQLSKRGVRVELVHITTQGDVTSGPLDSIGGRGLFTNEIQRALLDDRVDLAVHSLKDLPTERVDGLTLTAVPEREGCGDVLVCGVNLCVGGAAIEELPDGARVGTGSLRRRAQLLHARGDLLIEDIRGNVETRLRKLDEGKFDAIVLAEAGLRRLGLADRIKNLVPKSVMLPAVGQGALGLETRVGDEATIEAVKPLDHLPTHSAVVAERTMLAVLRGGCLAPVGAWGRVEEDGKLRLDSVVLSGDGSQRIAATALGAPGDAEHIGQQVAEQLIEQGARQLIAEARQG